jgi:leucyl/phenylalanyl-tRNA--protein transferase
LGVAMGGLLPGLFFFHPVGDPSKARLVARRDLLAADGDPRRLIDVQWRTDHLATLGVTEMSREDYLRGLPEVLSAPLPQVWA